jgi:gliding motility-associated lipoprotein GldD
MPRIKTNAYSNQLIQILSPILLVVLLLSSCMDNNNYTPKRKGYFRIDMPEIQYVTYNDSCPFTFDYPTYAKVVKDNDPKAEPCWLNIIYPRFKATLYISYLTIDHNLENYLEESRNFVVKHEVKASAINEQMVVNPKKQHLRADL